MFFFFFFFFINYKKKKVAYERSDVDIMLFSFKDDISNISITEDDKKMLEFLFILNKDSENMISNFRF